MATTGRPDAPVAPADEVATACREAGLVTLVGATSGESLAALGLLGRAFADAGVPFKARLVAPGSADTGATDADLTVAVARPDLATDHAIEASADASLIGRAADVAAEFGSSEPALALAGALAGGVEPPSRVRENADAAGIDRRPGVAGPTADTSDALAHSTLVHAPFSGDREAAEAALADLELGAEVTDDDGRRVASLVALAVAEREDCPPQATHALERALHPAVGGPFETIGGYADVLDALARQAPGLGIAVALGRGDRDGALTAWRQHARDVHDAVADAELARHDGLAVATVAGDSAPALESVARLLRDYRSPEPTVLLRGPTAIVVATVDEDVDAAAVLTDAVASDESDDASSGNDDGATVVGDAALATVAISDNQEAAVEAVRRALR